MRVVLCAFAVFGGCAAMVGKSEAIPTSPPLFCTPSGCIGPNPSPTPYRTPVPTPEPTILVQQGEPIFVDKRYTLGSVFVGPGQTVATQLFCSSIYCGPDTYVDWNIYGLGPGLYEANLAFSETAAADPNTLFITSQQFAIPQSSYVEVAYQLTDPNGNILGLVGNVVVNVQIVGTQVIAPSPSPTPIANLNASVNAAVAKARCQPGSGFGPHNGCAIAFNKIMDTVLGHTIPRVEGGDPNKPPVPGSEMCQANPTTIHSCKYEWVPDVVEIMVRDGYAVQIQPPNQLLQGDIDVQDGNDPKYGQNHIGFCDNNGCSQTISNADTIAELCGVSNATYSSQDYPWSPNAIPTFYRLIRK